MIVLSSLLDQIMVTLWQLFTWNNKNDGGLDILLLKWLRECTIGEKIPFYIILHSQMIENDSFCDPLNPILLQKQFFYGISSL